MSKFNIEAEIRQDKGTGASRRLRRQGRLPAILYGGQKEPQMLSIMQHQLQKMIEDESFYSSVLTVQIGDQSEKAVLKAIQRHPAKPIILHIDLMRVQDTDTIRMKVPLHFVGADKAPGVKMGGRIHYELVNVELICQAQYLPQSINVDLSKMEKGQIIHLSDLILPEGVKLAALLHGDDEPVVSIH